MDRQLEVCGEAPFYTLGPARDRRRPRLRPYHQRHRRGDDRLVRHRDALLRHAQGAPRPPRPRRRQGRRRHLQARRPRRRPRQGPPRRPPPRRRAQPRPLRVPLARPVQPVARPRNRRAIPRPDPARRRRQDRAFLQHVRPQVLQHEDQPGSPRIRPPKPLPPPRGRVNSRKARAGRGGSQTQKPAWPKCPSFTAKAATSSTSARTAASTTDGRPLRQEARIRTQDPMGHLPPQGPRQGHARAPAHRRARPADRRTRQQILPAAKRWGGE